MTVSEAIRARRSIRVFKSKPIEEEKLQRILEVARLAPTARNMQERKFVVVRERALREQLMKAAKNQTSVIQAPVVIAACGTIPEHVMTCGQLAYPIDVAIAVDHMSLQAVEEGLGSCWVCAFSEPEVKRILAIPETVRVVALLVLGYPGEAPQPRPRNPLDEMVCFDRYQ
jgi:nitroreductase